VTATLTALLKPRAIPLPTLHQRYGALLELVRKLIGVVPNCDPYLEIWPPGFRTYNVMVPNFLNLPFSLWGVGAPVDVVGLGMYVSSRAANLRPGTPTQDRMSSCTSDGHHFLNVTDKCPMGQSRALHR